LLYNFFLFKLIIFIGIDTFAIGDFLACNLDKFFNYLNKSELLIYLGIFF